ncbi:MAG TPA: glutaredoxin family protein [Candidatus Limnocylindrales bacterium]|nr:glutaredoxin family protein [Candidatus Limnocylindrales bacterium]
MTAPLPDLLLYTRPGCHLCDEARATLEALVAERAAQGLPVPVVREIDIAADPELERAYFTTIPVVEIADRRVELATSPGKLRRLLHDALDGTAATPAPSVPR